MSDPLEKDLPAGPPSFRFRRRWQEFPGYAFGLREPGMLGVASISLPHAVDFAALDAGMAQVVPERPPTDEAGAGDALRLLRRALFWAGALQRHVNIPVFSEPLVERLQQGRPGEEFRIVVPAVVKAATLAALDWIGRAINGFLLTGRGIDLSGDILSTLQRFQPPGTNIFRILHAAHTLDIPARYVSSGAFALGTGVRTRWLQSSLTDRTSLLASMLAGNKMLTAEVLRRAGLPAATHAQASSPEEAVAIARRLGYPVVVKPADLQQGRGVAAGLESDAAVVDAYKAAAQLSKSILVEKHFEGSEFRLSVVEGKLFWITARLPGGVFGDGEHTIRELVDLENLDPVRLRRSRERQGYQLVFDAEARALVTEVGKTGDTVPAKGEYVRLRRRGNISAGGTGTAMGLHEIHPDNARLAENAANALRLDIAGVDLIIPDIKRSWLEVGALINEVNTQPQLTSRSTLPLVEHVFAGGSRIPVILLIGDATEMDREELRQKLPRGRIGYASSAGLWLGRHQIAAVQESGLAAGEALLNTPDAEAAIIHMTPQEVVRLGLPCDSCDALVVVAPDRWSEAERHLFGDLLDIAGPHAGRAIHMPPSQSLRAELDARHIVRAEEASLAELCATLMRSALSI